MCHLRCFYNYAILENITKAPLKMLKSLFSGVLGFCMLYETLTLQEQSFTDVLQSRCSSKFFKFHWKIPALEALFNNVAGLKGCNFIKKKLQHRCFPVKFAKLFRTLFYRTLLVAASDSPTYGFQKFPLVPCLIQIIFTRIHIDSKLCLCDFGIF